MPEAPITPQVGNFDPAFVATLPPATRATFAETLVKSGHSREQVNAALQIEQEPGTPSSDNSGAPQPPATPRYPVHARSPQGYSQSEAVKAHAALESQVLTKYGNETDEQFAARQAAHKELIAASEKSIGDTFGLTYGEDPRTPQQQQIDRMFPAGAVEDIQLDNSAWAKAGYSGEEIQSLNQTMREALAATGMPAPLASAVGNSMLQAASRFADAEAADISSAWQTEKQAALDILRMSWEQAKPLVRAALDRIPKEQLAELGSNYSAALTDRSVIVQLARHGERIAARG